MNDEREIYEIDDNTRMVKNDNLAADLGEIGFQVRVNGRGYEWDERFRMTMTQAVKAYVGLSKLTQRKK